MTATIYCSLRRVLAFFLLIALVLSGGFNQIASAADYNKAGYSVIDDEGNLIENNGFYFGDYSKLPSEIVEIAVCYNVIAALDKNGELFVWGNGLNGFIRNLPQISDICAGNNFIAAMDTLGGLHFVYTFENSKKLQVPENLAPVKMMSAGSDVLSVLTKDDELYEIDTTSPKYPRTYTNAKAIARGYWGSAVIANDDSIRITGSCYSPPLMESKPIAIAVGESSVLALGEDGKVYGNVIYNEKDLSFCPKPKMKDIVKIAANYNKAAAISKNGKVYVWGVYKRARAAGEAIIDVPLNLPPIKEIALGYNHAAALGKDGKIYVWGQYYPSLPAEIDGFSDKKPNFPKPDLSGIEQTMVANNFTEFKNAVNSEPICKKVIVKSDITISRFEYISIAYGLTVVIEKGVTFTIDSPYFYVGGTVENRGEIKINGDMILYESAKIKGSVTPGENGNLTLHSAVSSSADIIRILNSSFPFNTFLIYSNQDGKVVIDKDLNIPQGKCIKLYTDQVLVVNKGVTVNNQGEIITYNTPIINGTINGNPINVQKP